MRLRVMLVLSAVVAVLAVGGCATQRHLQARGVVCTDCDSAASPEICSRCGGHGTVEIAFAVHRTGNDLLREVNRASSRPVLRRDWQGRFVAENGSYYGEVSLGTSRPKVVFVDGYFRKDGTYVQSHYRSLPGPGTSARGPPLYLERGLSANTASYYRVAPFAENGSYYGQLNSFGTPKTVYVRGHYRKDGTDGTYVRSHYRSKPRR